MGLKMKPIVKTFKKGDVVNISDIAMALPRQDDDKFVKRAVEDFDIIIMSSGDVGVCKVCGVILNFKNSTGLCVICRNKKELKKGVIENGAKKKKDERGRNDKQSTRNTSHSSKQRTKRR
jgi:hypothetical protein